jgi:translocation and assembly module TamB
VDFVNPYRIEPRIDLAAETDIRRWTISLLISGTPDDLAIELASTPPETNEEILSLLAFGKTTDERLSAGATASEFIANTLTPGIKDATGIDRLEVNYETDAVNGEEKEEIKVTVGKDLSRRLSVAYGTETKSGERIQRVTSDYKLLERLIVSAFQDTAGDYGGEVKFRLEFR